MRECVWPECLTAQEAVQLCWEINQELLGVEVPVGEKDLTDYRAVHDCQEPQRCDAAGDEPPF